MNNVDKNVEINQGTKDIMKAEARFLRAYFYFCLLRRYGPVYIWGDQDADILTKGEDVDRHTLAHNVDFILSEYEKAIAVLPVRITDQAWLGRLTKGAAMAAKAELLLYMARPLFNGAQFLKGMKNKDGENIFPQTADPNKWEAAAKAAKDIIDLNQYALYEDKTESDPFKKAIKSPMPVFTLKNGTQKLSGEDG